MGDAAGKLATFEDILAAPEGNRDELIDGVIYSQAQPGGPHAVIAGNIFAILHGAFHRGRGGPGGWLLLAEPGLLIQHDHLVPDIAGWRRDRMAKAPNQAVIELTPDWVCEVLSDSTRRHDRVVKMPLYAKWGVKHLWIVDPIPKTLECYSLDGRDAARPKWLLMGTFQGDDLTLGDEQRATVPFDAIDLELGLWWEFEGA